MNTQLIELRKAMEANGIDVYFMPSGDFHNSEYFNDYFKTIEYVSGFTGEAAEVVVTMDGAYLWTDGRYFLQANEQLAGTGFDLMKMREPGVPTIPEFLAELAKNGAYTLGFDGRVVSAAAAADLANVLEGTGVAFKGDVDLAGDIWAERPAIVPSELFELPLDTVGMTCAEKVAEIREIMSENGTDYLLLTDLMETAWLTNVRGNDIMYTPVFFSYVLLGASTFKIFVMDGADPNGVLSDIPGLEVLPYESISEVLAELPIEATLWLDSNTANYALCMNIAEGAVIIDKPTPVELMKAVKNEVELASTTEFHKRDAVAMVKFINWVKKNVGKIEMDEVSAADYLEACRREQDGCFDLSFETIAGYGPNAAIIHYAPQKDTCAKVEPKGFLLVDSGGQYYGGTTDITRTLAVGPLTQEEIDGYTYVLKGHLAVANAVLTPEMDGFTLNEIARAPMREVGLDFNHGLSHGVGHVLGVHEAPRPVTRTAPGGKIYPGFVMSNEPGLYIDYKFGIRTENEIVFYEDEDGNLRNYPITFVPYEREAINKALLTEDEIKTIDEYHAMVREVLLERVDGEVAEYVIEATKPL